MLSHKPRKYKIFNEDCRNLLTRLPEKSIDLILTDPPYNLSQYSTGNISLPDNKIIHNNIAQWDNISISPQDFVVDFKRILKPTGNIFIFTSYNLLGKWHEAFNKEFSTFQIFVWHKTTPTASVYKNSFLNSCELIVCLWNRSHHWNFLSQNKMHNFFECSSCTYPEKIANPKHPTQKPLALLEHLILIASVPNDIIFDPFMGVGSTGEAALKNNRRFIGSELDETYFNATFDRLKQY